MLHHTGDYEVTKWANGPLVYQAVNLINGKKYIGICSKYLSQRISKHFYSAENGRNNMPFCRAIRKYGREMFRFSVLSKHATYSDAAKQERRLINLFKPEYNAAQGGLGNPGWKHTPEALAKMSASQKGKQGYWKGKKLPSHVAALCSQRNLQPHRRARWKEIIKMGHAATRKQVICLDDGIVYNSPAEAGKAYGTSTQSITYVCSGYGKTAGAGKGHNNQGRRFAYVEKEKVA
jgi:group I intron endonuclease